MTFCYQQVSLLFSASNTWTIFHDQQKINEQVESGKLLEAEEADMYEKYLQVQMELSKETDEENERLYNINDGKRRLRSRR